MQKRGVVAHRESLTRKCRFDSGLLRHPSPLGVGVGLLLWILGRCPETRLSGWERIAGAVQQTAVEGRLEKIQEVNNMSEDEQVIEMVNRNHEAWKKRADLKRGKLLLRRKRQTVKTLAKCGVYLVAVVVLLAATIAGSVAPWLGTAMILGISVVGAGDVLGDVLAYILRWRL